MAIISFVASARAKKQHVNSVSSFMIRHAFHEIFPRRNSKSSLMALDPISVYEASFFPTYALSSDQPEQLQQVSQRLQVGAMPDVEQLSPTTALVVFIIGIVPFIWATYEFWRRIAFGEPFGTGSDSVVIPSPLTGDDAKNSVFIGEDGNPTSSRGRRTLDKGALLVAYVLFGVAASVVAIAVASVVMGPQIDVTV